MDLDRANSGVAGSNPTRDTVCVSVVLSRVGRGGPAMGQTSYQLSQSILNFRSISLEQDVRQCKAEGEELA